MKMRSDVSHEDGKSLGARGKCAFVAILAILMAQGCDDGASTSSSVDPCQACGPDQVCNNGICYDPNDPCLACGPEQICLQGVCYDPDDPCTKCTAQEECIDHTCKPRAEDDPCAQCTGDQICVDKQCKDPEPEVQCDPPCDEGKTCVDGRCAVCIGSNCFFVGEDVECVSDEDCPEHYICNDKNECEDTRGECDPACSDGQICENGTCVNTTLLWTLCRSGSDCGVGECIFSVTPSRTIHLEINGQSVEYTTDNPIPVSLLDSRINPETYNQTHSAQAGEFDDIGICSFECTTTLDRICPTGWSCQLVAKGILDYPDSSLLPQDLSEAVLNESPFAALCRRDMDEVMQHDLNYGTELCNSDESKCDAAGMVFYDGMCLEPCEDNAEKCPFFFSCQAVEGSSGSAMACVPDSGTCTGCYDRDKDGAGYGHCKIKGIDCDDDNPNAYYQKPLACSDIVDDKGKEIKTDLNCNGLIDKFELVGTTDNCSACGNACNKPKSTNITVTCEPVDPTNYYDNWRTTAAMDAVPPEFECVERCSFGYGDCKGNATCDVALLSSDARLREKNNDNYQVHASDVITGENGGMVYGHDADEDGYAPIDNVASVHSATDDSPAQILFDQNNTLICCSNNTNYCYTANKAWESKNLTNVSAEESYVTLKDGCKTTDPFCYDSDDSDSEINPEAVEICDGKDNDGSRILLKPEAPTCSSWCADTNNDCDSFLKKEGDIVVGYKTNPYCDATQDGLNEPNLWVDTGDVSLKEYSFGETCSIRNESADVCNPNAVVKCLENEDENSWMLKCDGDDGNGKIDGIVDNLSAFDGIDDDCDGKIDEDAWVPCVITNSGLSWESLKDGITNTKDYKYYLNSSGYSLPKNEDGSINLCRLGILQSKKIQKDDDTYEFQSVCRPIYEPRAYDYLGDGVDSNCDGADYDYVHAIFVAPPSQGMAQAGDDDKQSCKYVDAGDIVSPCSTINGAIQKAIDENGYYQDIIVQTGTLNITMDYKDATHPYPSPITLPNYGSIKDPQRYTLAKDFEKSCYSSNGESCYSVWDSANARWKTDMTCQKQSCTIDGTSKECDVCSLGDIIYYYENKDENKLIDIFINSAYGLHDYLVSQKRKSPSFKINDYLFSYDSVFENSTTHELMYNTAAGSEQNRPDEIIRIYGGFDRGTVESNYQPTGVDYWQKKGKTSVVWDVAPEVVTDNNGNITGYTKIYSMVGPSNIGTLSPLSLRLVNLDLQMKPDDGKVSSTAAKLIYEQADGITFVGINGSRSSRKLTLQNSSIMVKAIDGYTFADDSARKKVGSSGNGAAGAYYNMWNSWTSIWYSCSKDNNHKGKDGTRQGDCDFNTNRYYLLNNQKSTYDQNLVYYARALGLTSDVSGGGWKYDSSKPKPTTPNQQCGYRLTAGAQTQSFGGMAGYEWGNKRGIGETRYGKAGVAPWIFDSKTKTWTQRTDYANLIGKAPTARGENSGGCDSDCLATYGTMWGGAGKGGAPGKNGSKDDIKLSFVMDENNGLYVASDRSQARGWYGEPGGGGGGGSLARAWTDDDDYDGYVRGGSGGPGG